MDLIIYGKKCRDIPVSPDSDVQEHLAFENKYATTAIPEEPKF